MTIAMNKFCPVSLADWIEVCKATGVPFVPTEQVSEIRRADYLNWTTRER